MNTKLFNECIGALNFIHGVSSNPNSQFDFKKFNQANLFINGILQKSVPLSVIFQFLKNKNPHIQFFGLRVMEVQVRKNYSSFNVDQKKNFIQCIIMFVLQVNLTEPSRHLLSEKIPQIIFEILKIDYPTNKPKLLTTIMNQFMSKNKHYITLKTLNHLFSALSDENALDINIKVKKTLLKHIKNTKLLNNVCQYYQIHVQSKSNHVVNVVLMCILNTLPLLEEKQYVPYMPYIYRSIKIKECKKNALLCVKKIASLIVTNINPFFNELTKIVDFKNALERRGYLECFASAAKKIKHIVNHNNFFNSFLSMLGYVIKNHNYFLSEEKRKFYDITRIIMKEFNKEKHKNFNLFALFTSLFQLSISSGNSNTFVMKTEAFQNISDKILEWEYLKGSFHTSFTFLVVHIPEKILDFVLSQLHSIEKVKNLAHFDYLCNIYDWLSKSKKLTLSMRKRFTGKFNSVLKRVLSVYLVTEISNGKVRFKMSLMNNENNLSLMLKLLKNFDVCYESDYGSMKMMLQKIFYISVKFPTMRTYILSQWFQICTKYGVLLNKKFTEIMNISNLIKSVYNIQDLILFYEGLIVVMDRNPNHKKKMEFLQFIFNNPMSQLFSKPVQNSISSPKTLMNTVILPPKNNSSKSPIFYVLFLFSSIGKKLQNDSLSPFLVKMLPSIITLLKSYHSLYNINVLKTIPENVKESFLYLTSKNEKLVPMWNTSLRENLKKKESPKSHLWHLMNLKWNAYSLLGYCAKYVKEFWNNSNLLNILANSVFLNLTNLQFIDINYMLKGFVNPFVKHCPRKHFGKLLSVVLTNVFGMVSTKLNAKTNFKDMDSEIFYEKNKTLVFREIGKILQLFTNEVDCTEMVSYFINGMNNANIILLFLELTMKILYHNTLKYFYLYNEFLLSAIPKLCKNRKFDQIVSFYLLRTLVLVLSHSKDYYFHTDVLAIITKILLCYPKSKYTEYIFLTTVRSKENYKNLLEKVFTKGIKFKRQKKVVRTYFSKMIGKGANFNFNLKDIKIKEDSKYQQIFKKYNSEFVKNCFRQKQNPNSINNMMITNINNSSNNNNNVRDVMLLE